MLKPKRREGGFTLIELLIVIAIIGILSTIILTSLSKARGKGADAKVKAQFSSLRSSAESYFDTRGSYSVAAGCTVPNSMFTDVDSGMAAYTDANNYPAGTILRCNADGSSYAVSANLTTSHSFWCVDSNGAVKNPAADPGVTTVCPD